MHLIEGLKLYEIVMLGCGILLLLVLIGLLIHRMVKDRPITPLLPFFILPVIMIGFPAFKKITFSQDGVVLDQYVARQVQAAAPGASSAERQELARTVSEFKPRAGESPAALLTVARVEALLGRVDDSKDTLEKALELDPGFAPAKDLQLRVSDLQSGQMAAAREAVQANAAAPQ